MTLHRRSCRRPTRRAFTLVEVMVVTLVLALLMSMMLPRLIGHERRLFQLAADQVGDLLIMFAQREALSTLPVGIWHDKARHALSLVVLDSSPDDPREGEWRLDRAVKPIKMPASIDVNGGVIVLLDGSPIDASEWPASTEPGKPRPRIEITLLADDGSARTIVLPSHAIAPYQDDGRRVVAFREPIDLDAAGRNREDW